MQTTTRSAPDVEPMPTTEPAARTTAARLSGALSIVAGSVILMGIITAEAVYPARYTTFDNEISDLGGTRPPDSVILQPSATIFDLTMIVTGLIILAAAFFLYRAIHRPVAAVPLGLLGAGVFLVGVFPGNTGGIHQMVALLAFVSGGVAAMLSARVTEAPFRWLALAMGAVSFGVLVSYLFLGSSHPMAGLGDGGVERWVAYPIVLWLVAFGGYLTSTRCHE
jgi:hypothetical membrane protein